MQDPGVNEENGLDVEHFHKRIHCRSGHVTVQYKGRLIVWGGFMEHPSGYHSEYHKTNELIIYNSFTEVWSQVFTTGEVPHRNSGSCGVILDDCMYVYGGFQDGHQSWMDDANVNHLYRLNLRTLLWTKLHPTGVTPMACDKLVGWVYKDKLYFFGGFGPPPVNYLGVPFQHIPSQDDVRGWNNQLLCYDPELNEWSYPHTRGPTPCPRAAHAADISGNSVFVFGGRLRDRRMRDLHRLNMDRMEWSGNLTGPDQPGPEGRSWHSLTFISKDLAILYGGFSQQSMILNDCWQLTLPTITWKPIDLHHKSEPRLWHQAAYLATARVLLIAGGHRTSVFATRREHADNLLKLNFEPKTLLRLCLNTAVEHFKETLPEWDSLPLPLQEILRTRLQQQQLHPVLPVQMELVNG